MFNFLKVNIGGCLIPSLQMCNQTVAYLWGNGDLDPSAILLEYDPQHLH